MVKKILIIANDYTTIINFRMELIRRLVDEGYDVAIALPQHDRVREIEALGCQIFPLEVKRKSKNPIQDIILLRDIKRILKCYSPDFVITYTIKPNVYGGIACTSLQIPYVATITGLGSSIENGGFLRTISLKLYQAGLKHAKRVFFQNAGNLKLFEESKVFKGQSELLPGSGVNVSRFRLFDYPSDDKLNFVFVGRVMKEKGIEEFFEAAISLKSKYPNCNFHICGPCEEAYQEKLAELSSTQTVIYHGMLSDMVPIYKVAHCIVLPSYHEGMANVLLEAAACGRPIIASDICGCRESIEDGKNGFLCECRNPQSLISAIEKFIQLPHSTKARMGINGRRKMESEFDRNIVVQKFLSVIANG